MKNNYTYITILSTRIVSDATYQRMVDYRRVNAIVNNFNPALVNAPKVSLRDGKYYVFDGQHTLAALKLINKNKPFHVECKVYTGLTREDEAKLFAEQNGIARNVETISKMKALYTAHDSDIVAFVDTVRNAGFIVDFSKSKTDNRIVCVSALYSIYRKMADSDFSVFLYILKEAWHGESESLNREILNGLAIFIKTYKGEFDVETAIKQFGKVAPVKIIRDGKAFTENGNKKYARQFVTAYNIKLRKFKLDVAKIQ